jgi:hypothetical protein
MKKNEKAAKETIPGRVAFLAFACGNRADAGCRGVFKPSWF